jgi:HSP20 family protein
MAEKTINRRTAYLQPRYSVGESEDGKIQIVVEMPGVRKENLEVRMENNELRILGRRDLPLDAKYVLKERRPGDYLQSFTLDETVDQARVDAAIQNGVLTLTLELKEQVKPRTIRVRSE